MNFSMCSLNSQSHKEEDRLHPQLTRCGAKHLEQGAVNLGIRLGAV